MAIRSGVTRRTVTRLGYMRKRSCEQVFAESNRLEQINEALRAVGVGRSEGEGWGLVMG